MEKIPFRVRPMLATPVREPFHKPGWIFEEKYDGDRFLAYKEGDKVRLLSRNGIDRSERFPQVAEAIRHLRYSSLLLDGEMVVFDREGVSRFQLLQQGKGRPVYAVFDCLFREGKDLRSQPLSARREAVKRSVKSVKPLRISRKLGRNGLAAFRKAKERGYEGLVAKDLSSRYHSGRSKAWLKVKVHEEDEFVIVGYTAPTGSRKYFGALLLGAYQKGRLQYVGNVGTGFDHQRLAALYRKFRSLVRTRPAVDGPVRGRGATFLAPRLVAQISYREWTAERKLRQPVFLGLREDKRPRDVRLPGA